MSASANPVSRDRKNGRFMKKSNKEWRKNVSSQMSKYWNDYRLEKSRREAFNSGSITSSMRRVTELQQLANDLWCRKCIIPLSLRNFIPNSDRSFGLSTILNIQCTQCQTIYPVHTGKKSWDDEKKSYFYDMNCKLALGCIDSGIGGDQINSFLSAMNMPVVSNTLLKRYERRTGIHVEKVAHESCDTSIKLEKSLTECEERNCLTDEVLKEVPPEIPSSVSSPLKRPSNEPPPPPKKVNITASFDAGWQKRGTGRAYNSLSGHASLIGYRSGKVLGYEVKSKACCLCDKGHPVSDHDCRKNHSGSAKAMEPQMAVDLVTRNKLLDANNVVVGTLVGDGDSCSIQAVRRESSVPVKKWLDLNHVRKGFSSKLYSMKVPDSIRNYLFTCFTFAIPQNKGDAQAVHDAILNIINHAYGEHESCGSWCGYNEDPQNFRHHGLPGGKPLTSKELRASLTSVLSLYAENAEKIAPCASSQANESFNNIVASKNPKSKFNAGSQALSFRVAAAVCQKNIGKGYIIKVNEKMYISPGDISKIVTEKIDKCRSIRSENQKTKEYKTKRMLWKRKRSSKGVVEEKKEGVTYSTDCELNGIADLLDDPEVMNKATNIEESTPVFFDLETTGLSKITCQICQIAAKYGDQIYLVYIVPHGKIPPSTTAVTGMTTVGGELFLNNKKVQTTPPRLALLGLISFLRSCAPSVLLVAHNGMRFDAPVILRHMRQHKLLSEFLEVVSGFIDTLHVFQGKLPKGTKNNQPAIAAAYDIDNPDAHNAVGDVTVLQEIVRKMGIDNSELTRFAKTVPSVIQKEDALANKSIAKESLKSLTPTVTVSMITKIATAGITLDKLQTTYKSGGKDAVHFLLAHDVNGKPLVTKHKKKIDDIVSAVEKTIEKKTIENNK